MRTPLLAAAFATTLAACSGGPADMSAAFEAGTCSREAAPPPTPLLAGAASTDALAHSVASSDTPYLVTLPAGAPGYLGIHVAEMHTTMELIVKRSADYGDVTMGGAASGLLYDMGPVTGTTCTDLYYYKLHADTPGDYELVLSSNAANSTWLAFKIVQIGHDI